MNGPPVELDTVGMNYYKRLNYHFNFKNLWWPWPFAPFHAIASLFKTIKKENNGPN